ncbi:HNH endonuclease [Marilutibacter alkalisoli]|uniref:Restriction endonuclease n=1 Tax=Marilutibacter alkalisoli TaxID=2591633 RepID=A0A514BNQ2_9GAMM|nr:HNH endonuclease [Lysobacter alkalisoli]QDH68955.1 restriction endonuclease [Lysobacter alkalisoli]
MANAIFTASESSAYDDRIEAWYHFPKTYLRQVEQAKGDFVLYYEPRRTSGPNSATGRQAYFAIAQIVGIEPDGKRPDHYYAHLKHFLEFDHPVPFREGDEYYESALRKDDGSTNRGAFGRSVRLIPRDEFARIVQAGLSAQLEAWERPNRVAEEVPEYVVRPIVEQVVSRKFRDAAFRRHVRNAYGNTCAVTGLRLINGGGRPEVQAAHIRPVEEDGPDTVRNGIALTGTVHWLFDRGLLSFDDDYTILLSPHGVPNDLDKLIRAERKLLLPDSPEWRPHPTYLNWHRLQRFKA